MTTARNLVFGEYVPTDVGTRLPKQRPGLLAGPCQDGPKWWGMNLKPHRVEMPGEPNYPKMPGEPKRVQPSRDTDRK